MFNLSENLFSTIRVSAMLIIFVLAVVASVLIFSLNNNLFYKLTADISGGLPENTTICSPEPTSSNFVNVKNKGATGDGITDDTASIQSAVDEIAGTGGTVYVPDGTYMINALTSINLKSNMTFRMSSGAVLKAITNSATNYNVIYISVVSDVNVIGGTIIGERFTHTGTTGQWGMAINITSSTNVVVEGTTVKDAWGDGIYVSGHDGTKSSKNISICSVIADNNRRQGMSIIAVDGMVVKDSIFKNTNGQAPMAGIDLEPNEGQSINNVQILRSQFINNKVYGIVASPGTGISTSNIVIDGNTFSGSNEVDIYTINISGQRITNNIVTNNVVTSNHIYGILLTRPSNAIVTGNTVTMNNSNSGWVFGIFLLNSVNNTVTGNKVKINNINDIALAYKVWGIRLRYSTGNTVTGNTILMPGMPTAGFIVEDLPGENTISGNTESSEVIFCGDGMCNGSETCSFCSTDCGVCPIICTSNWLCEAWSTCINSQQTRNCIDSNNCNTTSGRPAISQSCVTPTPTPTPIPTPTPTLIPIPTPAPTLIPILIPIPVPQKKVNSSCGSSWQCSDQGSCTNSKQLKKCIDLNGCSSSMTVEISCGASSSTNIDQTIIQQEPVKPSQINFFDFIVEFFKKTINTVYSWLLRK